MKKIIKIKKKIFLLMLFTIIFGCSEKNAEAPPDMVLVAKGNFIMGSNDINTKKDKGEYQMNTPLYEDEYPAREVFLSSFLIDKFEVTNLQFWRFKKDYKYPTGRDNHPAFNVNWFEADQYCRNMGKRLPTAEEWEKAARGPDGSIYPWGNEFKPKFANTGKSNKKDSTPVGIFENGKSYYGAYDMLGNAAEWTASWYKAYPETEYKNPNFGEKRREIRGGSWGGLGHYKLYAFYRLSYRRSADPRKKIPDVGFRCAKSI